ncbi:MULTISPECIES: nicotinate-nucleotide--dimethylbenzimidazole phosphoribosyltransferase [Pseudonocardia]|uniref:Nicotinate-nucleotide--dimethylbenzimidazole phosphoribosyltransferase n=1 Tax=Pseudonocardia dioxanivorans (strain ATCC 55486 / DSM 44775 / JCM 13855 / CB1190) TaxID=675635 RepID=F4CZN9_PSEUX|nr:nicotinate-nucleotide--dimethylbenzimidazole phosphoribosyltransferase [Pseudonocardia dioxanivorans]AEA26711.1 Nicotinate-nucleotide--dimethylbenzimidazole phosphoribosyltransferase [Pseudonocardia dioxanivorans CB1190]GJF05824.1 nicotinate-nucleotide--dimethylbenzimidazole phosphoribosyltransferase [Pseudonocardia sp. D17]
MVNSAVEDLPTVPEPSVEARREAVARHDALAVAVGGLGRLAELGCWLASVQGTCPPHAPLRPRVVVVAADHGIAAAAVSAYPAGTTALQVTAARDRTMPAAVVAPVASASVRIVDAGLDDPGAPDAAEPRYRVRRGSGRIDVEDALTEDETDAALRIGRALADEEVDAGADLLVPGSLGVGATTAASTLVAAVTGIEPVAVVGRGSGIDDNTWMRKAAAVRDALRRTRPVRRDPVGLLRTAGGADIAVLTGFLLQASLRRTPVLLDGLVVTTAALLAEQLAPGARRWWLAGQRSPEPAVGPLLERLALEPVLDLGIRLGDGTGALAVVPMLQMAARLLADTAPRASAATGT